MMDWATILGSDDVDLDNGEHAVDVNDVQDAVPPAWGKPGVIVVEPVKAPVIVVRNHSSGPAVATIPVQQPAFVPAGYTTTARQVTQGSQKVDLMQAHKQWATRPADERFWTVGEMAAKCREYKQASHEELVNLGETQIVNDRGDMLIMGGKLKGPAQFTHYAFGQLCNTAGAPAGYLRELDGDLAAQCLTSGLRKRDRDVLGSAGNVLIRQTGEIGQVNAFLSQNYSRIWNADVVGRLQEFESRGWRVPPARPASMDDPRARRATAADVLQHNKGIGGLAVNEGDLIAPAGLYASDRDCFAFMVSEASFEVSGSLMNRGFFMANSEVGDLAWSVTSFLYDAVCGNHIVWGASNVIEIRLVHRGRASSRWVGDLQRALTQYASKGTEQERQAILTAIGTKIADDKDGLIEKLFKNKSLGLTKTVITEAYEWSVKEARLRGNQFSPLSVWGMVCGLTRVSQECGWADQRVAIDQAAGKLMKLTI